ncbi:MAG: DUF3305 domain-containing protein [Candidatus Wenzhouxiangella sp. M2_3B_020]
MAESNIERRPVTGMTLMMQHDSTGWQLTGLFPEAGPPPAAPQRRLVRDGGETKIYQWQGLPLRLQPDQGDDYIYNLTSPGPMLFVICKTGEEGQPIPLRITADQDDCVAAVEVDEIVFEAPMPRPIIAWIREYVETHWEPGPRKHERKGGDGRQRKRES